MRSFLKISGIVILLLICFFAIFIVEEGIRLNKNLNSKPLIVIDRTKCDPSCAEPGDEITIEYWGIGYKLNITYYHSEESSDDNQIYKITKEEFLLFNKIRLWSWVLK